MTHPPAPPPDDARRIAALIGGMLGALLAVLLGVARPGKARALPSVLNCVLRSAADVEMEAEAYVEWVAVPAPWRAGRLLPRHHARALGAQSLHRTLRTGALVHGPPAGFLKNSVLMTGMA